MCADERLLHSAIANLVQNGTKFTKNGGSVTLRAQGGAIDVRNLPGKGCVFRLRIEAAH